MVQTLLWVDIVVPRDVHHPDPMLTVLISAFDVDFRRSHLLRPSQHPHYQKDDFSVQSSDVADGAHFLVDDLHGMTDSL